MTRKRNVDDNEVAAYQERRAAHSYRRDRAQGAHVTNHNPRGPWFYWVCPAGRLGHFVAQTFCCTHYESEYREQVIPMMLARETVHATGTRSGGVEEVPQFRTKGADDRDVGSLVFWLW
jgi:hypothetical protein